MPTDHRAELAEHQALRPAHRLPARRDGLADRPRLVRGLGRPVLDFTAEELGIDPKTAAKIQEIKRLRPLSPSQPWGIFFVKFEPKRLPVVALRRILSQVALKKRASANSAERAAWAADDLLFVSNYGEGDERQISFAHFSQAAGRPRPADPQGARLGQPRHRAAPRRRGQGADRSISPGPTTTTDVEAWRKRWRAAFTLRHREVITTSKDLSIRLAELARAIRDRIKTALAIETDTRPAHQADEGVPGGAGPRPRRRRLRRHVRADHRLRPALGAHRRPAARRRPTTSPATCAPTRSCGS